MNVLEVKDAINVLKKHLKISKITLPQYKLDELGIKYFENKDGPSELGYRGTDRLNILGVNLESH